MPWLLAALLAASPVVELPFEVEDERVYVPVEVGGLSASMVLDTGVSPTVLDAELAAGLGLDAGTLQRVEGVGVHRSALLGSVGPLRLSVGGVPLAAAAPSVVPLDATLSPYTGRHAPGIIGAQFFREHTVTLDFTTHRLRVGPVGSSTVPAGAIVVPLSFDDGVPFARASLETVGGAKVPMKVVVDLGAKATLLVTEPFLASSGLAAKAGPAVRAFLGAGVGGPTRYDFVRGARLRVGAASVAAPVVGLSVDGTLRSAQYDALLGLRFLRRFKVTLDYAKARLVLEPGPDAAELEPFDASGLYVCARGPDLARFEVEEASPGSPAARAGLARGDVLVDVDGHPLAGTTLAALRRTLSGAAGTQVRLGVRRGEANVLATFTLERRL